MAETEVTTEPAELEEPCGRRAEDRDRAVAIGERLEVLKDHPTPPNGTSPYAPIWIGEMIRRQNAK